MHPGSPQGGFLVAERWGWGGVGWGCECSLGRLRRTKFNRFVSNDSAEEGKGRGGHPDTPAAVRDLALLALDLSFPIWKMGLTVQGRWRISDSVKRSDGC